jgi:hypothetical protein
MVPLIAALGSTGASSAAGASPAGAAGVGGGCVVGGGGGVEDTGGVSAIAGIPDGLLASSLFWHDDNDSADRIAAPLKTRETTTVATGATARRDGLFAIGRS